MFQVTQSPFLQALGYAIINSLWQVALLWLLSLIVSCLGKPSSHKKYVTGIVFQLAGFTWFTGTLIFYYNQCLQLSAEAAGYGKNLFNILHVTDATSSRELLFSFLLKTEQFLPYLSIAYLLLLVILSLKWMQAYNLTQNIRKHGLLKIDVTLRLFVQNLSAQLGIKKTVKIFLSGLVKSPLTIGFFKPVILMPIAAISNLSTHQLEALILHELAHIRRHDYLINLISSVIEALLFFNPFMHLLSKSIRRERENSCDDWVLQFEYSATTYARALLQLATFSSSNTAFAMNATDSKKALLGRVKRMIEKKEQSFNFQYQLIALLFLTGIMCLLSWSSLSHHNANRLVSKAPKVVVEPMVAVVENPLFNPIFFLIDKHEHDAALKGNHIEKQVEKTIVNLTGIHLKAIEKNRANIRNIEESHFDNPSSFRDVAVPEIVATIDSLALQHPLNKASSVNINKQLLNAEKEINKLSLRLIKSANDRKVVLNTGKVFQEVHKAINDVRATKLIMMTDKVVADINSKLKKGKQASISLNIEGEAKVELEQLLHAAEDNIYDVLLPAQKHLEMIDAYLPLHVYNATNSKPYTFSYDYKNERPVVAPSVFKTSKGCPEEKAEINVFKVQKSASSKSFSNPSSPKATIVRSQKIIRI